MMATEEEALASSSNHDYHVFDSIKVSTRTSEAIRQQGVDLAL